MKHRSSFGIYFHIVHSRTNKEGKCPIHLRITVNSTVKTTNTKLFIELGNWNAKRKRAIGNSEEATEINEKLDQLEQTIRSLYLDILAEKGFITADIIMQALTEEPIPATLLKFFEQHNEEYAKRVGVDRRASSLKQYEVAKNSLEEFIKLRFNKADMPIKEIEISFINDYDFYMRSTLKLSPMTIKDRLIMLRKIIRMAKDKNLIRYDPFVGYNYEKIRSKPEYLTEEELRKIMDADIPDHRICHTRDLFVFSCFTGLSIGDIMTLSKEDICDSSDGRKWIIKKRNSTNAESKLPLFDIPEKIIEKHCQQQSQNIIFTIPSVNTISKHMRILSKMCGLERDITFRMGRPCFANVIAAKNGVPTETISRMMGYSSAVGAQKFINVSKEKIAADMKKLMKETEGDYDKMPQGNPAGIVGVKFKK